MSQSGHIRMAASSNTHGGPPPPPDQNQDKLSTETLRPPFRSCLFRVFFSPEHETPSASSSNRLSRGPLSAIPTHTTLTGVSVVDLSLRSEQRRAYLEPVSLTFTSNPAPDLPNEESTRLIMTISVSSSTRCHPPFNQGQRGWERIKKETIAWLTLIDLWQLDTGGGIDGRDQGGGKKETQLHRSSTAVKSESLGDGWGVGGLCAAFLTAVKVSESTRERSRSASNLGGLWRGVGGVGG